MHLTAELVARCFRPVPPPDGSADGRIPVEDADVEAIVARLLAARAGTPVWVFAYGSLIWKPAFEPAAAQRALARGWHRSFCIELVTWRGTPEAPGLMMALAPGGSCAGLALRLDEATAAADLAGLVRREMPIKALTGNARWITVETAGGMLPALTFYANPVGTRTSHRLPAETVARRLALACGHAGSCAEYLYNTVAHLEAEGIRDRNLWRLQRLVAEEIGRT
jgi:glutathione-specific gamma-glutamylcyclotransferase